MQAERPLRSLVAALLLGMAGSSFAQAPTPPLVVPAPPVSDQELQAAFAQAQTAAGGQNCAGVLTALDPLVPRLGAGSAPRITAQRMRLACLGAEGRVADLPVVQKELVQALPKDGLVRAIGVLIAADENRFSDAATQITAIANSDPAALEILTGNAVRAISMRLSEQKALEVRGNMLIALARADWQPADFPDLRTSFAEGAIDALVGQKRQSEAEQLLDRIDQPEMLASMAIDRRYTALWPAIEGLLGPSSTAAVDHFAQGRLAVYSQNDQSEVAQRDAVNAMLLLRRYQDVLYLSDNVAVADGMSRDAVRIILYRARALAALGRIDEADQLFARFLKLDAATTPEVSTALVSYAEMLDENGREQKAIDVVRATRATAWPILSDYGKRWIDRTEVCALSALGRTAEAGQALTALVAQSAQNPPATIEALLCARRDAEAAALLAKSFGDDEVADNLVLQFQPAGSTFAPMHSRLRDLWLAFLARPEVKAAFEKRGRVLPRSLWPQATERAIPRRTIDGSSLT